MKRGWMGVALLLVLLISGVLSAWWLSHQMQPMGEAMEEAVESVMEGNWDTARALTRRTKEKWQRNWHLTAVFADHAPMEEIDALFARLAVYEKERNRAAYGAICAELSLELEALGDDHVPSWWNIL